MKFFDKDPLEETFMRLAENELYEVVTKEVMQEQVVAGIWGRAFSDVEGDMDKAKALYIKYRVQDLKDRAVMSQVQTEQAREEAERKRAEKKRKKAEAEGTKRAKEARRAERPLKILKNLSCKVTLQPDGTYVVDDEHVLSNVGDLISYVDKIKSEISDDQLKKVFRKNISEIYNKRKKTWVIYEHKSPITFDSDSQLRAYMIKVLFMEDD